MLLLNRPVSWLLWIELAKFWTLSSMAILRQVPLGWRTLTDHSGSHRYPDKNGDAQPHAHGPDLSSVP